MRSSCAYLDFLIYSMLLDLVCYYFVEDACRFINIGDMFGFDTMVILTSYNKLGYVPSSSISWKSLWMMGVIFFF